MTHRIILELVPRDGFDFTKVVEAYSNGRPVDLAYCDVKQHSSIIDGFKSEFVSYISRHGLSTLFRQETLLEELVPPGTGTSGIQRVINGFLSGLSVTTDLAIIDPYFFTFTADTNYPTLIENVLQPTLATLRTLTVVTLPNKVDTALVKNVATILAAKAPSLNVVHRASTSFHDRFWINPITAQGFICGTSLNGLGKKYALVDYLQPSDAADVIAALRKNLL